MSVIWNGYTQGPSGGYFGDQLATAGFNGAGDGTSNGLAYQNPTLGAAPYTMPATTASSSTSTAPVGTGPGNSNWNSATGLPSPTQIGSTAPAPIQAFGATPSVTPTYVDPNQNLGYMQEYMALQSAGLQPQFQQQDQQLDDQLAARGITSSGAAQDLTTQLQQSQGATLASAEAPIVSQGYGYTQQDITGNANAANAAAGTNAQYYASALGADYSAYNNYLNTLYGTGANTGNENYTAYLNSFSPSSGVTSAYNTATGSVGNTYGNVFNQTTNAQGQALGSAFGAAGDIIAAGEGG